MLLKDSRACSPGGTIRASRHKEEDREPVNNATINGSRMALKWTSAVPATMFVGYLALVMFFASRGGYTAVELDSAGRKHETTRHPSAEDAIEEGEEGPSSGQA